MTAARKGSPPYLSYRTFRNFLDSLGAVGVPNRIDRSVMSTKNGTAQGFLLSAFGFFGLVSDKSVSTDQLQRLVKAEGAERRNLWRKIIVKAYPALFNSKINLETATFAQFAEVFSNEVSSQDTIRKCVTFFLYAARDAGIKISPHVKPYAGTRPSRQARSHSRKVRPQRSRAGPRTASNTGNDSPYLQLLLDKFPNFDPNWPAEVRNNWLSGVQGATIIAGDGKVTGGFSDVEEPPDEDPDDRQLTLW